MLKLGDPDKAGMRQVALTETQTCESWGKITVEVARVVMTSRFGPARTISDASRESPAGRCRGGLGLRRAGAGEQIPRTPPSWRA
ncbi:MAG: hypothetical protein ACRDSR_26960, partial [Pseudonocardiaceae bacterium]